MSQTTSRNLELDFLRGIAVILVMFRHHWIGLDFLQSMGWIGVDLFFVLSGFLVAGLLFSEDKRFGSIKPGHFLIRRGFKIYPLFYLSILFTIIRLVFFVSDYNYKGKTATILTEIFFLQNYLKGFWGHHWSLAIEEHFYFILAILIFWLVKTNRLGNLRTFSCLAIVIFVGCLILRFLSNIYLPENQNFDETHLRIDSLFAGVCLAYAFHFHIDKLKAFYSKYQTIIFASCLIPLFFTPFLEINESFFTRTIGFTLLYIAFTALLMVMLFSSAGDLLSKILTFPVYRAISKIGFYSYSIYLFHLYSQKFLLGEIYLFPGDYRFSAWTFISFLIYFASAILLGVLGSHLVEMPFLKLRDRWFPRRTL